MEHQQLAQVIEPLIKGCFTLPTFDDDIPTIYMCGVSSGIDSTATALCLKYLYPELNVQYVFTDTRWEAEGTEEAFMYLKEALKSPIIRLFAPLSLMEQVRRGGNFLPSHKARTCTKFQKIDPLNRYINQIREEHNGKVRFVSFAGIRADEPRRTGAQFTGDTLSMYPLQALGLVKADVNKIVNDTVAIPYYYNYKTRSGCPVCIYSTRGELIEGWQRSPDKLEEAAELEELPDNLIQIFEDFPTPVSQETGISRNWLGFVRPQWLGYKPMGYQTSRRGKKAKNNVVDMFSPESKHIYAAVEYEYHPGISGMALPQVYFENLVTYSTSLTGIKKALSHFWLFRLHTKELHLVDSEEKMSENRQMAIVQIEVDDWLSLVPEKPEHTYTWQSDGKPLKAIRKAYKVLEHILLCEGLRQIEDKAIEKVTKEYGRVLHFCEYEKPNLDDLIDDLEDDDTPEPCMICSK